ARTSTGEDFGKCCRTASIRGREGEGMGERVRRILTGAISEGTHAGEEAPRHSYYQADAMDGVSNIRNNFYEAEDEPDEHHSDGLRMNEEPRSRVKSAFHPDVTEQAVNHPGDAAEIWAVHIILPEIGQSGNNQNELCQAQGALARLDHGPQNQKGINIKKKMK